MDMYFQTNYTVEETVKTLSKCSKGHFMKYEKNANRLLCESCNLELSLPEANKINFSLNILKLKKNSSVKIVGEKTCPVDKFQMICYSTSIFIKILKKK